MNFIQPILKLLFPPHCPCCGEETENEDCFCVRCWKGLEFITKPYCDRCGRPFLEDVGSSALCGPCLVNSPPYNRARSVWIYNDRSKDLVVGLKRLDRTDLAYFLARWMVKAGQDLFQSDTILIPVPLHRWRLLKRRYNQSALLAHKIAYLTHTSVDTKLLERYRETPSQVGRGRKERIKNLQNTFRVPATKKKFLQDRHIIVIDDVLTTGATLSECTRTLLKAGAGHIDILTLTQTATPMNAL